MERRDPAICNASNIGDGKDEMTKASIDLQDLRRRIYVKAKAEPSWRFWGLYVHVCKVETLRAAYEMAKQNDGAPGVDGVTFEAIEAQGAETLLEQLRDELTGRTYKPLPARRQEIPKDGGKVRVLSIPAIRDRVVQGALKLILEPVFEADFQPGSFGYRPKRTAHDAIKRVADAIVQRKTRVLDFDLRAYFDNVRHDRLLEKVAQRVDDVDIMHLLKVMLKASGKKGVPQGGVISPLLSNLYLNEVDRMLERAREVTRKGKYTYIEYARFADDLVILIDAYKRHDWLVGAVDKRLREEFGKLQVEIELVAVIRQDNVQSRGAENTEGTSCRSRAIGIDVIGISKRLVDNCAVGAQGSCALYNVTGAVSCQTADCRIVGRHCRRPG